MTHALKETRVRAAAPSIPGAWSRGRVWGGGGLGCGPQCVDLTDGAGGQPRKDGELSQPPAAAVPPGGTEVVVWLRVYCLLSFTQCCPLIGSLRGTVLHQVEWIFAKLVKLTCKLGSLESMKPLHSPNPTDGEFL